MRTVALLLATAALAACKPAARVDEANVAAPAAAAPDPKAVAVTLARLDCGSITIKNFDKFFSDKPGLYSSGPREVTDSCYLIHHGDQYMLWDSGLPAELKGKDTDMGDMIAHQKSTLVEQLAAAGIQPEDIAIVGISHSHADHIGQAAAFPNAKLIIGAADFDLAQKPAQPGEPNPLAPWAKAGAKVQKFTADTDVFGDGTVEIIHLPGHTPDHAGLLVKTASGAFMLSGDTFHSTEARQKRGVPPFNTNRAQSVASMDRIDQLAKDNRATLVIQHEPADIVKVPALVAAR